MTKPLDLDVIRRRLANAFDGNDVLACAHVTTDLVAEVERLRSLIGEYREVLERIARPDELVEANDVFSIYALRAEKERAQWALDNLGSA